MCLCCWICKTTVSLSVRVWWVQIRVKPERPSPPLPCRLRRNMLFEKRDSCVTLIHFHALLRGPVAPFIKASWTELCVWLSPGRRCKFGSSLFSFVQVFGEKGESLLIVIHSTRSSENILPLWLLVLSEPERWWKNKVCLQCLTSQN